MAALVADVRALSLDGTFTALTDAQIQTYLDLAALELDEDTWGACYDTAQALLAAHHIVLAQASSAGGPVQAASAGGLSVSYGSSVGASGSGMGQTRFGAMLERLQASCGILAPFAVTGASLIE